MKLLHFALITPLSPQIGLRDALRSVGESDGGAYSEFNWIPYLKINMLGALQRNFLAAIDHFQPDLIFAQVQTAGVLARETLNLIKVPIIEWCGDCRDHTPEHYFQRAPFNAITLFSNRRDVANLQKAAFRADYLNIGFSPTIFRPDGPKREGTPEIVFAGNNYVDRFPRSGQRIEMVRALQKRYGERFAVYGSGWGTDPAAEGGWLPEPAEAAMYRSCKIAINQNHFDDVPGFTSDRIFRAMGSGALTLSNEYPGIDDDFPPEITETTAWRNLPELCHLIDHYLYPDQDRPEMAAKQCAIAHARHSWQTRVEQLKPIFAKLCGRTTGFQPVALEN